jgi:hypothetical protein
MMAPVPSKSVLMYLFWQLYTCHNPELSFRAGFLIEQRLLIRWRWKAIVFLFYTQ